MTPIARVVSEDLDLPAHLRGLLDDEQFREELLAVADAARARMRAAPNPLASLTREDISRSRASALPEIIGVAPKPRDVKPG